MSRTPKAPFPGKSSSSIKNEIVSKNSAGLAQIILITKLCCMHTLFLLELAIEIYISPTALPC